MYFISDNKIIENKEFLLNEDESFHIKKVLRAKLDDKIKVFDFNKVWLCEIVDFKNKNVLLKPIEIVQKAKRKYKIKLYFPFIDRKLFEYVIKKSIEIGCDELFPLITEFTQKHNIFDLNDKKDRIDELIKSAMKQSESTAVLKINNSVYLKDILKEDKKFIIFTAEKINQRIYNIYDALKKIKGEDINIVTGPEGGFSEGEKKEFKENFIPVKISYNILRAETAAISALSIINGILIENENIL